jgi:predicted transcriptional regulator of viral defense system
LADWLLARGRHWVTTGQAAELLGIPEAHVPPTLARWVRHGWLFSPARGLYVAIPSEFRLWGAVPASHFVDPMMRHLGHPYYVCLLSAAEVHGFAHQRPQVFQVMVGAHVRDRSFGRVHLSFHMSRRVAERPTVEVNTPTGTMRVSTPAVTVLDLVSRPGDSGALYNVGTVIGDMILDEALDLSALVSAASGYPASVVQRTGWLIDEGAVQVGVDVDTEPVRALVARASPVLLDPSGDRGSVLDRRWNVFVNAEVEIES